MAHKVRVLISVKYLNKYVIQLAILKLLYLVNISLLQLFNVDERHLVSGVSGLSWFPPWGYIVRKTKSVKLAWSICIWSLKLASYPSSGE